MKLSVIICAHNPRDNYLRRVLDALSRQSLSTNQWELLLVDNASSSELARRFDLSWHSNGRHIHEKQLGLTHARLCGISNSAGDLLIFVDDDNVLSKNYLEMALQISDNYSFLGAWGGVIRPEFETEPPEWTREHWGLLALRSFDMPIWSNDPDDSKAHPCGAGLCIRRSVAEKYLMAVKEDGLRKQLGRRGDSLMSAEDSDLVLTSADLGLGWGNFPSLSLTHLIPASRLTENYLVRLAESITASTVIMRATRNHEFPPPRSPLKCWLRCAYIFLRRGRKTARFFLAHERGHRAGLSLIADNKLNSCD